VVQPSDGPRNSFAVERWRVPGQADDPRPTDLAVPVVDGVPLFETLGTDWPGLDARWVAPPSRQWLGAPEYREYGRSVVLEGSCGVAGCCGVVFRISVFSETVVWDQPYRHGAVDISTDLRFEFDAREYEAQLRAIPEAPVADHTR
jgi:hypothetical protein